MAKSKEFWQGQTADETYDKDYAGDLENGNNNLEYDEDYDEMDEAYDDISEEEMDEYLKANEISADMNRDFEASEVSHQIETEASDTGHGFRIDEGLEDDLDVMETGGYDDADYDDYYDDFDPVE